jgi:hypothetical protein
LTSNVCLGCLQGLAGACHALEVQLWSCLQAFANWPTDAAEVYPGGNGAASAFSTYADSRVRYGTLALTLANSLCLV